MSRTVTLSARSTAPPNRVFETLADVTEMKRWTYVRHSELARPGTPAPFGVGALRRVGTKPFLADEEVVVFDPPGRFAYELRSGMPVRYYRGEVTLSPSDGGTDIRWQVEFEPKFGPAGPVLQFVLRATLGRLARDLARAASNAAPRRAGN